MQETAGHNSIATFKVDQDSGQLTFVEWTGTEGDWPRDFVLDPTEQFIVASNQETGNLVLFERDQESGKEKRFFNLTLRFQKLYA